MKFSISTENFSYQILKNLHILTLRKFVFYLKTPKKISTHKSFFRHRSFPFVLVGIFHQLISWPTISMTLSLTRRFIVFILFLLIKDVLYSSLPIHFSVFNKPVLLCHKTLFLNLRMHEPLLIPSHFFLYLSHNFLASY